MRLFWHAQADVVIGYVLQGIGYGFVAAVEPGPFQTYLISQTLTRGWRRALPIALAPLISDGPVVLLVLFVLSRVPESLQRFLYIASGLFILYLARNAFLTWRDFDTLATSTPQLGRQNLLKAAMMNALSPGPYVFWSLVTGPILLAGWREAPAHGIGFLAGFYGALVASLAGLILVFGTARQFGPKVTRALLGVAAVVLVGFGLYQLWQAISFKGPF